MQAFASLGCCALLAACAGARDQAIRTSTAADARAAGMVDVATMAPGLQVEMRYAGSDNFVGRPIRGYQARRCYLLRTAAQALARVQASLRRQGETLLIFDCYRPVRAVQDFVAWAHDPTDQRMKARYYPRLDKRVLLGDYIAERSGHSRGATVDLGIARCAARGCTVLDMGTGFDLFDPAAHTDAPGLDTAQRDNRRHLVRALAAQGFAIYPLEWWHFTLQPEPTPHTAYDFPVR